MAESPAPTGEGFDLEQLQRLVEMMEQHGLTEVSLKSGALQWRLRRGSAVPVMVASAPVPMAPSAPVASLSAPAAPQAPAAPAADPNEKVIKSPTVGTFYASPTPEEPPFVSVGTRIAPETVVCLIEAMKVFNQIPAEVAGTVTAVLVQNGEAVEFGQPLFRVRA